MGMPSPTKLFPMQKYNITVDAPPPPQGGRLNEPMLGGGGGGCKEQVKCRLQKAIQ